MTASHSELAEQTWFTRAEAERYTRTSKRTILRAVRSNDITYTKTGPAGHLRFRREWLEDWLAKRARNETAAS